MKYNKSEIMKNAWYRYRKMNAPYQTWESRNSGKMIVMHTFGDCLKAVWAQAKEAIKAADEFARTGLRRMHYSEYKTSYADCQTVEGSYDKRTKTIEVMTKVLRDSRHYGHRSNDGLCPYCHTYCNGDCRAH